MAVIKFFEENKQQYVDFVTAHESGSFLQSWSWGDFQTSVGKTAVRFGELDASGKLVGTAQFLKTKVPHLAGFYLYSPYGPLGENEQILNYVKKEFSSSWFIRLEPKQTMVNVAGKITQRIQPGKTLITDLTLPLESLLTLMHQKTRYNIKVAAKYGVEVIHSQNPSEEVLNLLVETSSRQKYHSYPSGYYEAMIAALKDSKDCKVIVYEAHFENELMAAAVMIDSGFTRTYLFGGSSDSKRSVMAPYAMHWQAMQDAKESGLKTYDWWGIETATGKIPGFVQFKLKWGGETVVYPQAIDIVQNSAWYTVYKGLRKLNRLF